MKNKRLKTVMTGMLAGALVISGFGIGGSTQKAKAANTELNLNGKYHAALGIQTSNEKWYNRFAYFGKENNDTYGTDKYAKLISGDDTTDGTFNDVDIEGNGTYTVSLTDADFQGETSISQLHIATDIPGKDKNDKINFTDIKVTVNDKDIVTFDSPFYEAEKYNEDGVVIVLANHWRPKLISLLEEKGVKEDAENGYNWLNGTGKENISVTFTVSGFNYNKGETPSEEPDIIDFSPAAAVGTKKTVSGNSYVVTKSDKKTGTVTLVTGKKTAAKITVPGSVTIGDYSYKVTEIKASAFAGNKKLTSVKIGKNVTKIGDKAFNGCAKLGTIDLSANTSLTSVGKNAVKGVSAKCIVKAPKSKKAAYKKLFAGKGVKVTVK
ncbi:leucine-rich repeat domain-containing protein [Eubacterium sp. MSJ-13]|uniref:leucine-rich repeat protein n=1 Tax=Eubacterium sp. MSJ-13 TaxID=2841513 RepID=UPI001C12551D|nr:leucine-rich repeat protein [Eubacterium sp. MSJ-13]MBU5479325.1 leucine-rich repeat domain-containing protein [Eubacterium sp. MSJ-13]